MQQTIITFPEIRLSARDAHKLRGYFGQLFQERSPLLHNHLESGSGYRYAYPLVQYKVVEKTPMLIGFLEGAHLLRELFLEIKELDIEGRLYTIQSKYIQCIEPKIGYATELLAYQFKTLWMPLNQKNYSRWRDKNPEERKAMLTQLMVNHILAAFKGLGHRMSEGEYILAHLDLEARHTQFKQQKMMAFQGHFISNVYLPNYLGIGKSVSRGFGTVLPKK